MVPHIDSRFFLIALALISMSADTRAQSPVDRAGPGFVISGTVVSKADGHALAQARVVLSNVNGSQSARSVISADDGTFVFSNLPAGKYSLQGEKRGFITTGYEQHEQFWTGIVTGAGLETDHLVLRLVPASFISGKVMDENGDPVRRASVTLHSLRHDGGAGRIAQSGSTMTDDQGSYEFGPEQPGTYFIAVTAEPWYAVHPPKSAAAAQQVDSALDVIYPVTYDGDTSDPDSATPIRLQGGERAQMDIHLAPAPALHLLVHVPGDDAGIFLRQSAMEDEGAIPGAAPQKIGPGLWELTGVSAGRYSLGIIGHDGTRMAEINATTQGQDVDTSTAESFSSLDVSVALPGQERVPANLGLALLSHGVVRQWSLIDDKGQAHIPQVAPSTYEIVASNPRGLYGVASISAEAAAVSGHTITIDSGSAVHVSLTLTKAVGSVEGIVKRNGRGISGTMVVLVPADPSHHADLFRRDQSDQDGTFAFHGVIPGEYTIVAIDDGWDVEWSKPEVMARYLQHGLSIQVPAQHSGALKLTEAVEAQSK